MNNPLLSICIPTYNRASYLKELLDSIVCQFNDPEIYNQVEIIISDNASEDNTTEIVAEYQRKYGNIRYFRNEENVGASKNGLILLNLPKGKYTWLIGDDDIVTSGSIECLISKIKTKDYSVVLINFDEGEHYNPKIKTKVNSLKIKNDKEYTDYKDFFQGEDFKNFHGINFLSVLVYNSRLLKDNFYKFDEFINTCYLQSYMFLILGTNGHILRIARPLVTWRSFLEVRRCDNWQRNEKQISDDFNGFVEYAGKLGYIFDENKKIKINRISPKTRMINFLKKNGIAKYIKIIYRLPRVTRYYLSILIKKNK